MAPSQAFISTYAPRLKHYGNAFLTPVLQTQAIPAAPRTTKRGTAIKNYADDADDDFDFDDDSESQRRPTGLRSLPRRDDLDKKEAQLEKLGREIRQPVEIQPIYRDWMIRRTVKPTTDQQVHIQAQLPLTLIPIRVDVDVPAHQPDPPFPPPPRPTPQQLLESAYRRPEMLPSYKLRDTFLWNLHETLMTPDDFALTLVRELDLPNQTSLAAVIASQIRTQLEDYAGVALHPLFHVQPKPKPSSPHSNPQVAAPPSRSSRDATPRTSIALGNISRQASTTPAPTTPAPSTPAPLALPDGATVTAHASPFPSGIEPAAEEQPSHDSFLNPDDTYRCIITLSVSLANRLYTDKFEWSLLHPPGAAEAFAKQTCADLGLGGEWVMSITHAIYEAVLRLKKEACEGGMMMTGGGIWVGGLIDNQAVREEEGAGWRYDVDDFGAEWEPKIEALSKEDMEKREGDRERQLRRVRRETAKFSSTSGTAPSQREREAEQRGSYFDLFSASGAGGDDTPGMGRGERSKKKRRFRSLSPVAKALGSETPGGVNGAGTGWGGAPGQLQEYERQNWRCRWCSVWGSAVWAVRDGPAGARTLCNNCGLLYERDKQLPVWSKELHKHVPPVGR